jgi:hypothetical protein
MVVAGRTVETGSTTTFKGPGNIHSVADLDVGDIVRVEGFINGDGNVFRARGRAPEVDAASAGTALTGQRGSLGCQGASPASFVQPGTPAAPLRI